MKTTLMLDDVLVGRVRDMAKDRGVSMSSVVEEAIVQLLMRANPVVEHLPIQLPSYDLGDWPVDIADRRALADFLDDDDEGTSSLELSDREGERGAT